MINDNNNDGLMAVELATELTVAWLANPNTRADAEHVPAFLGSMHAVILKLSEGAASAEPAADETLEYKATVSVRKSLASSDHIISMIDGKPYKTLRRHLAAHGLTPEEYKERYGLKAEYPMVAPSYSENRRAMAKKIGLGRKPRSKAPAPQIQELPFDKGCRSSTSFRRVRMSRGQPAWPPLRYDVAGFRLDAAPSAKPGRRGGVTYAPRLPKVFPIVRQRQQFHRPTEHRKYVQILDSYLPVTKNA
jgi:predicted transcriptional regulator